MKVGARSSAASYVSERALGPEQDPVEVSLATAKVGLDGLGIDELAVGDDVELDAQGLGDPLGELVLELEHIGDAPLEALVPQLKPALDLDHAGRDSQAIAGEQDGAIDDHVDAELRADVLGIAGAGVAEASRGPGAEHPQAAGLREQVDELVDERLGEVVGLARASKAEGQDREAVVAPVEGRRGGFGCLAGDARIQGQLAQPLAELGCRGPSLGIRGEAVEQQAGEFDGDPRIAARALAEVVERIVEAGRSNRAGVFALVAWLLDPHLVDDQTERVDVARGARRLTANLFGREVHGRRGEGIDAMVVSSQGLRSLETIEAEITQDSPPLAVDHHTEQRDVAVNDTDRVGCGNTVGDLGRDIEQQLRAG